ncbi:MAG: glycosyltransferase [Pseudodonghicola sp.]
MKLLVLAHRLELGGTQVNAIELAAHLRDRHGFDVTVHATEGPALELLRNKQLAYVPAPDVRLHPSPRRMRQLRALTRQLQPDLIHAWDWWQGLEAYWGVHLPARVPLVITDMMMSLTRVLPRQLPTTFGFEGLRQQAQRAGWRRTHLLLPPVDTRANAPGAADGAGFRAAQGVAPGEIAVVSVSRLAEFMKSESLQRAIEVMRCLGAALPLKLVIVGDGAARPRLEALAAAVNAELGRTAITFAGALADPRPAYAAADIVLGMGGSALRGLAFAKPLIVVGEKGFAHVFSPQSADRFRQTGIYGRGGGSPGNRSLAAALRALARDPALRQDLGAFGRHYVIDTHGLDTVADGFAAFCAEAVAGPPGRLADAADAARSAYYYLRERRFLVPSRDRIAGPALAGR